ncbi:polyadenylate-binding -interacting 2B-like protein [Labeo rohita]|uniref:Polyadenylate-binding-interacting 2B-like protein n=1 Tax=Labeo rohita TaxID=84645 RepID=A0A498MT65_LABRO|nr:polyadenylate-binding -interacting 2B-like protein [Labeo rohita]
MRNSLQRKRTSSSTLTKANIISNVIVIISHNVTLSFKLSHNATLYFVVQGRRSDSILKRLQHGPAKVTRSTTYNAMTNGHHRFSFPIKSTKSEVTTESINNQMPVPKTTAKTSAQTKGVIRVSGISIDYSESELIKMASPFGHCVEVLMAAEVDTATCLEWNKALLMFPTEFSAQEMVKVYSAIPVHMRQQSLELVSQTVDFSSPVSVFHAFVGPSLSNAKPADINSPEVAKTPGGGSGSGKDENVVNGHKEGDANPFAEYMWMENEEEYNRQVEEELLEQEFLERCFQEMLEEEDQDWFIPARDLPPGVGQIQQQFSGLSVSDGNAEDIARKSSLNPEAKEFVPGVKY